LVGSISQAIILEESWRYKHTVANRIFTRFATYREPQLHVE